MTIYVDISIGPVQDFVAQSRRTRDLWGSSYLLSFLSAHAMMGVYASGGTVVRPNFDVDREPLLQWVAMRGVGEAPRIGSVPNHFVVKVDNPEHGLEVATAAEQSLRAAWSKVSKAVWNAFVEPVTTRGNDTTTIWDRQVGGFWELLWVIGSDEHGLLHRRKHWRTHRTPDEPGDKCMVMPELQELSGHIAASGGRNAQNAFWTAVRAQRLGPLDLRDEERLSAVALVKRLYPKVAKQALGWKLNVSHWRSTVYVAALPWIRKVAQTDPQRASAYASTVHGLASGVIAEKRPMLAGPTCDAAGIFACLDANYFHVNFLEDPRLCPLDQAGDDPEPKRGELVEQLRRLQEKVKSPPPIFYAMLLADGDRLGKLVEKLGGSRVGTALGVFTSEVPDIVRECDGVTIYAGGDDVLAMLPVPRALECAQRLSESYQRAFGQESESATLSVAVTFAHIRSSLRTVITESHRLLDKIAKTANGRSSLAVGVLKRGGLHCQWTTTWQRHNQKSAIASIQRLAEHLQGDAGLSATLLHRLHSTLGLLCGWPQWRPGAWARKPKELHSLDINAFVAAEVKRSLVDRVHEENLEQLEHRTNEISNLLVELLPRSCNGSPGKPDDELIGVDVLLLAAFLAGGYTEEVG